MQVRARHIHALARPVLGLAAAVLAWFASLWIPPFQSPDEAAHIARAYLLADGNWFLDAPAGKMSGGYVDSALVVYTRHYVQMNARPDVRLDPGVSAAVGDLSWNAHGQKQFIEMPGTGYYFPAIYAPHALGLKIAQWLDLDLHQSYLVTRFGVILTCTAIITLALVLHAPSPMVSAVFLLPMQLFQLLSPTIDGITTSLSLLIASLYFWSLARPYTPAWSIAVMAASLFLVVTSRPHLLPMLLMPFALALLKKNKAIATVHTVVTIAATTWLWWAARSVVDHRVNHSYTTKDLIELYIDAPLRFFEVLSNSLNGEYLLFYYESFIGVLGFLDTRLAPLFYDYFGWGLVVAAIVGHLLTKTVPTHDDLVSRMVLAFIALASTLMAFFAMLVTWTPHPTEIIEGVQGRYFIVPALLVAFSLDARHPPADPLKRAIWFGWIGLFGLSSLAALHGALMTRYWE